MSKLISFKKFEPKHTARPYINKIGKALSTGKLPYDAKLEEMLLGFYNLYDQYIHINSDRQVTIDEINGAEVDIVMYFNQLISNFKK